MAPYPVCTVRSEWCTVLSLTVFFALSGFPFLLDAGAASGISGFSSVRCRTFVPQ